MAKMKAGPIVTDNGNFVIDAPFPESQMKEPAKVYTAFTVHSIIFTICLILFQLLTELKLITGVVEVGLFCNIAKAAYFGNQVRHSRLYSSLATCSRTTVYLRTVL